ncbi:hypothetical protein [Bacillus phage PK2]|nr:hypothetical protein [Bacillus phage PK2]
MVSWNVINLTVIAVIHCNHVHVFLFIRSFGISEKLPFSVECGAMFDLYFHGTSTFFSNEVITSWTCGNIDCVTSLSIFQHDSQFTHRPDHVSVLFTHGLFPPMLLWSSQRRQQGQRTNHDKRHEVHGKQFVGLQRSVPCKPRKVTDQRLS